jgi:DNA-directed RNA polymerase subunit beta'
MRRKSSNLQNFWNTFMKNIVDFSALQIKIASPADIMSWSHGEVKKPETINYRSLKPEKDGLFDEKIFGPSKDYECYCGKYKRIRYKGIICDKCGVEVTESRVRRERMAHIKLAAPVAHIWFFKGAPSKLSLLLDISPRNLNSIMYFSQYIVLGVDTEERKEVLDRLEVNEVAAADQLRDHAEKSIQQIKDDLQKEKDALKEKVKSKETLQLKLAELELKAKNKIAATKQQLEVQLEQTDEIYKTIKQMVKKIKVKTVLTEDEYLKLDEYDAASHLRVGMGAESVLELVKNVNLDEEIKQLRDELAESKGAKKAKVIKRLRVVEGFKKAAIDPAWTFMTVLPVLPPDLRPMVQLSGGRFAASDLNDLYRRVINRNNRLAHLIHLGAPSIILRNEKRMLQEAVDALIDSSQAKQNRRRSTRRPLRSLSEMLRGKTGRFRQNLLGKRVDYSGRSVIVVGPELKLNQCGLPKDMALEMFKPYVLRELIVRGIAPNVKSARHLVDRRESEVYAVLEKVIENHPVLLNRAPTLHKLGIQAFYPVLIEGNAIALHPCVCSGYNADFDGDQMAVHVPLTKQAQEEAIELMMANHNLLKPANGEPITVPNKDMALGSYYYTSFDERIEKFPSVLGSQDEAIHLYQTGKLQLRQRVTLMMELAGKEQLVETCVGRLLFNAVLPESLRFINEPVNAKKIKLIVTRAIEMEETQVVADMIDAIKDLGFAAATKSGLSVSVTDCGMIDEKDQIIDTANQKAELIKDNYLQGLITDEERRRQSLDVWIKTTDELAEKTWETYTDDNSVKLIIDSGGTRASKDQVKQLAAMRGLVVDPLGNIVEMPTKSNFRQGLSIFEYVTSARGSRKGLTDSAIKTADAGYLTRRLVDVAHDAIIRTEDCGTTEGVEIKREPRKDVFYQRILGRYTTKEVKAGNKVLAAADSMITDEVAQTIVASDVDSVFVRSPLTCRCTKGLCAKCYGWDFSTRSNVEIGVPVGVVAAQSIGEPGTQLTMRVKHSGGIVGLDVTQGLPRVEELLEARNPKVQAIIAHFAGKVKVEEAEAEHVVTIKGQAGEEESYHIPSTVTLLVKDKDLVAMGQELTPGGINVQEMLQLVGLIPTQAHIIDQVQAVYESQGIAINDKHFEVIVRKMGDKLQIEMPGDTDFLVGEVVERSRFMDVNDSVMAAGGDPATARVLLLGITRSSLFTSSWLSAASFQHTKHVLTDASSEGAVDYLEGLKENVIIGRLIPTSEERARLSK